MDRLNPWILGATAAITFSILSATCALAAALFPDATVRFFNAWFPFMDEAAEIPLYHEEHFDGSGYPRGLAGTVIPLWARLFAVIDTLDAMTSDRPYRKGLSFDAACAEILRFARARFDPYALDAFVADETTLRNMVKLRCGDATLAGSPTSNGRTERPWGIRKGET